MNKICAQPQKWQFRTSKFSKIDFTQNLSERRIMKFSHCGKFATNCPNFFTKLATSAQSGKMTKSWEYFNSDRPAVCKIFI